MPPRLTKFIFFFFNDTATTEIYTLSLHDALPIWEVTTPPPAPVASPTTRGAATTPPMDTTLSARTLRVTTDRKSTRLNSSHGYISYAVFCLKKKHYDPTPYCMLGQPSPPSHKFLA